MKRKMMIIIDGMLIPFAIYVGITVVVSYVYTTISLLNGKVSIDNLKNINYVLVQGIASAFMIIVLIPLYRHFKNKYDVYTAKFNFGKVKYVITLAFALCVASNILLQFLPSTIDNAVSKQVQMMTEDYGMLVSLFIVSFLIPIVEELLFRGFLYSGASLLGGAVFAIAFTSTLFGLIHFNLEQGIYAVIAGVFLSYVRYKYDSVLYAVIMHLMMNATSIIFSGAIYGLKSIREKMFVVFIMLAIIIMSMYKIKESDLQDNN